MKLEAIATETASQSKRPPRPNSDHFVKRAYRWLMGQTWPHQQDIVLLNKPLLVRWSAAFEQHLQQNNTPIYVEMQMYFSCNIVKYVRFHDKAPQHKTGVQVRPGLYVFFNPVMKRVCNLEEAFGRNIPFSDFEIVEEPRFVPSLLSLDVSAQGLVGEYRI